MAIGELPVIMHNSYDGREFVEALVDPLNWGEN
jgi:hypothetical protein